jgi:transcriptional regulator of arginine metabolism
MKKQARHFAIKEIILSLGVGNQEQVVQELKKRGIRVTQATLSRDISELGVMRTHTKEGTRYSLPNDNPESRMTPLIGAEVISIFANEVMIVIRTLPGRAPGVASFVDSLHHAAIIGTVAGDDTVLILPSSVQKTNATMLFLKKILIDQNPR